MSAITILVSLLVMPIPAWLMVFIIGGLYLAHQSFVGRRLDGYARSLNHMDRWADSVEARLEEMGYEDRRAPVAARPAPPRFERRMMSPANDRRIPPQVSDRRRKPADYRELSDSEVTALISRLIRDRAA
jgi:hypothetical protein